MPLIPSHTEFSVKADKRPPGSEYYISPEVSAVPLSSPFIVRLTEIPLGGVSGKEIAIDFFVETTVSTPAPDQFYVDYESGVITFNSDNAGDTVTAHYWGTGSVVAAAHINLVQEKINDLEDITSAITADGVNFEFPNNVQIDGDLTIKGTMTSIETVDVRVTDHLITLNYGALAGADTGIEVYRGDSQPMSTFEWVEADQAWKIFGTGAEAFAEFSSSALTTHANIVPSVTSLTLGTLSNTFNKLYIGGNIIYTGDFSVIKGEGIGAQTLIETDANENLYFSQRIKVTNVAGDITPTIDDVGCVYYNSVDKQFKGIKDDGLGNPVIVILG